MSTQKIYRDSRGWKYKVMAGINCVSWKGRYQKPDRDDPYIGWKCMRQLPWRNSKADAQADLDRLAEKNGWTEMLERCRK